MAAAANSANPLAQSFYCERCGQEFKPEHRLCPECRSAPTRHWLQFMSLCALFLAFACNSAVALFVLPRMASAHRGARFFRVWLWFDMKAALYGWLPIILGLLAWDYFIWRRAKLKGTRPKIKRWVTRKVLSFVIAAALTPLIPWWIPAGQVPYQFLSMIGKYPGTPATLAWAAAVFVLVLLCCHRPTRDSLLGNGRMLSLLSLSALLLVLAATVLGWSLTN